MVSSTPAFLLLLLLPLSLQGLLRWVGFSRSQIDKIVTFFFLFFFYKTRRQSELNNQPFLNLRKSSTKYLSTFRDFLLIRNKAKLVEHKRDFRHGELMMKCIANVFILFWINDHFCQYYSRRTEYRLFHTRNASIIRLDGTELDRPSKLHQRRF